MTTIHSVAAMSVLLLVALGPVDAANADDVREQRQAAQKERQLRKSERNQTIKDATREFKDFVRKLRSDYRERINDLEKEFDVRRVELRAEHDARVVEAQAEYQKKLSELLMRPDSKLDEAAIREAEAQSKLFSDELFELRKAEAEVLHNARVEKEMRKNTILTEQDRLALEKASSLGLTDDYSPILAEPIGDGLTSKEQRWNDRELEEVVKLKERNSILLSEYANGESLRKWEIENLREDFRLTWDEKAELHALEAEQIFYNALLAQAKGNGSFDQKKIANKVTELAKQSKLIELRYKEIRDRNRIERREKKTELLAY